MMRTRPLLNKSANSSESNKQVRIETHCEPFSILKPSSCFPAEAASFDWESNVKVAFAAGSAGSGSIESISSSAVVRGVEGPRKSSAEWPKPT